MTKNNKLHIKFVAVLLLLASVIAVCVVPALAKDGGDGGNSEPSDYRTYYSASDVLELSGVALEDVEREYLNEHVGVILSYDDMLHTATGANVSSSIDDSVLTVSVTEYRYTATGGIVISWVPIRITFGDRAPLELSKSGGAYIAEFNDVTAEERDSRASLRVEFKREFTVPTETLNAVINKSYNDAVAWDAYISYLGARQIYNKDFAAYEEYVRDKYVYDENLADYNDYLIKLGAFETALKDYNDYLAEMEEYKALEEVYNKYQSDLKKYEEDKVAYDIAYAEYLKRIALIEDRLSALEATKVKMVDDREIYAAIMGRAVDEVLENEDILTGGAVGANPEAVDEAGRATDALRELLPGYFSLKTVKERYEYYITNYDAIKESFIDLTRALDCLYANKKIRTEIAKQEGKSRKFVILVAQLSYVANALSDEPIMSYPIHGKYPNYESLPIDGDYTITYKESSNSKEVKLKISDILENKTYMVDTGDADPDDGAYPDEVIEPIAPEKVEKPTRPTTVDKPVAPDVVADPGDAPAPVTRPTPPTPVYSPIPSVSHTHPSVTALLEAYKSGELSLRDDLTEPLVVTAEKVVSKSAFSGDEVNVTFCTESGEVLDVVIADSGSHVVFFGEAPTRPEDERATYVFDYWAKAGTTERADLLSVTEDLTLYPVFRTILKKFPITFNINGKITLLELEYGSIPVCPDVPTKPGDEYFDYVFSGWDKELAPVSGKCEYTAQFDPIPHVNASAPIPVEKNDAYYVVDASAASDEHLDISRVLERAASGRYGIVLRTHGTQITLGQDSVARMLELGDSSVSVSIGLESYGCIYRVVISAADGTASYSYPVKVSMPDSGYPSDGAKLTYVGEDGERVYVPYTLEDGLITFNMTSGVAYTYAVERNIDVLGSELVGITASQEIARPGDTVRIETSVPEGIRLNGVYLKYSDGTEVLITDGEFVMPDSDVLITVSAEMIEYEVIFMNGGRVIASYKVLHGGTVTPPTGVTKKSDGTYTYTFLGWSSDGSDNLVEIGVITSDVTYTAVYEKTLIPVDDDGFKVSARVLRLLIAAAVALGMIVVVVIPAGVISIVLVYKNRKMKRK